MTKPLKPLPHAVIDYVFAAKMIAAPWLFGFSRNKAATMNWVGSGAAILGLSLMTRYPLGAVKLIPFPTHGLIEATAGIVNIAAQWLMGFADNKRAKWASAAIWVIFIVEFGVKLLLAPRKLDYLKGDWLMAVALFLPAARVFRLARVLRAVTRIMKGRKWRARGLLKSCAPKSRRCGLRFAGCAKIERAPAVIELTDWESGIMLSGSITRLTRMLSARLSVSISITPSPSDICEWGQLWLSQMRFFRRDCVAVSANLRASKLQNAHCEV
jgi:hypothetical protein